MYKIRIQQKIEGDIVTDVMSARTWELTKDVINRISGAVQALRIVEVQDE